MMVGSTVWLRVSRLQPSAQGSGEASSPSSSSSATELEVTLDTVRSTNSEVLRATQDTSEQVGGRQDVIRLEILAPGRATLELIEPGSKRGHERVERLGGRRRQLLMARHEAPSGLRPGARAERRD